MLLESGDVLVLSGDVRRQDQQFEMRLDFIPLVGRKMVKDLRLMETGDGKPPVMTLQHRKVLIKVGLCQMRRGMTMITL